ncbi:large-conductance mechanosensitive channel protein MscL [Vampirovibrio sp.]|uniref:large-conductance mechanosensitive channel protein MscL n=1 Tax=Vampirovibrio sp. TaxID=2717857 RepID=UPI0035942B35
MGFIQEFKAFAVKGNMVDLAVGVIIGGAFGKIVTSLVSDIIMPPLGLITGGINFEDMKLVLRNAGVGVNGKTIEPLTWNYGSFIQHSVDFLLVALSIFLVIKTMNQLRRSAPPEVEVVPEPEPTAEDVLLLTEIRDLLKKQR